MNNERLAQKIIQIYQKYGRDWTELRGDYLYEKVWLDRFLALLPSNDASVLDLGCGSGQPIAAYFIENGCQVTGVDRSEVMLEIARESFPEQTWINADMRHFRFDQQFDGILAWDSFFHLTPDDQREMFAQFSAHAKRGAALMFTSGRVMVRRLERCLESLCIMPVWMPKNTAHY